jgi:multidrug resistance efflux pump
VKADAAVAEVDVQQAKANWARATKLFEQKAISAQDYDRHRFAHEAAMARLEQARARVAAIEAAARPDEIRMAEAKVEMAAAAAIEAQTQLAYTELRAPIDGVILHTHMEPGELVSAEHPTPVVTMTSLSQVRVRAYVEELDALSLQLGAEAVVTVDGRSDVKYHGKVTWAAPVMGPKTQRHHQPGEKYDVEVREVLIVLDDARDLVVGLPVNVFISRAQPDEAASATDEQPDVPQPPAT